MATTQGMADQAQDPQSQAPPGGGDEPQQGSKPNVSPEEDAMYRKFVLKCTALISDEKMMATVIQQLKSGAQSDPVGTLANITVAVVMRVQEQAKSQGEDLDAGVMMHGGYEVLQYVAYIAKTEKIHEYTDQEIESAIYRAMDQYRAMAVKSGLIKPEEFQADMDELKQANADGSLDKQMPGMAEHFANAMGAQPPANDQQPPQVQGMGG